MERFKKYETARLETWTLAEGKHPGKQKLIEEGAVFKPGTIRSCANLLAVVEQGATIELCGTTQTRYEVAYNGIVTLKNAFGKFGNMIVPSAMAAESVSQAPSSAVVFAPQAQPLDP